LPNEISLYSWNYSKEQEDDSYFPFARRGQLHPYALSEIEIRRMFIYAVRRLRQRLLEALAVEYEEKMTRREAICLIQDLASCVIAERKYIRQFGKPTKEAIEANIVEPPLLGPFAASPQQVQSFLELPSRRRTLALACLYFHQFCNPLHAQAQSFPWRFTFLEILANYELAVSTLAEWTGERSTRTQQAKVAQQGRQRNIEERETRARNEIKRSLAIDPNRSPSQLAEELIGVGSVGFKYDKLYEIALRVSAELKSNRNRG
jgi:hypothetical protein